MMSLVVVKLYFVFHKIFFFTSLVGASEAEAASSVNQHLRHVWVCPHCQETLAVNMAEQLAHQGVCELVLQQKSENYVKQHLLCIL